MDRLKTICGVQSCNWLMSSLLYLCWRFLNGYDRAAEKSLRGKKKWEWNEWQKLRKWNSMTDCLRRTTGTFNEALQKFFFRPSGGFSPSVRQGIFAIIPSRNHFRTSGIHYSLAWRRESLGTFRECFSPLAFSFNMMIIEIENDRRSRCNDLEILFKLILSISNDW